MRRYVVHDLLSEKVRQVVNPIDYHTQLLLIPISIKNDR